MLYKVFLVEDEIVTREGIRDSLDWAAAGCRFCGEASDGEVALPLIIEQQPDIVITDIKMPFVDGLQLCRILRQTLPSTKIIILSGHSEFKYAQEAISLGVTEYLLKPVSARDILQVLQKLAQQIDAAQRERAQLKEMERHSADYELLLRERVLLNLVSGALSPLEAIEQARELGLELLAPCYQLALIQLCAKNDVGADALRQPQAILAALLADNKHVVAVRRDHEETLALIKASAPARAGELREQLTTLLRARIDPTGCSLTVFASEPFDRLAGAAQAYKQLKALAETEAAPREWRPAWNATLAKPDTAVIHQLLRSGVSADFPTAFARYIAPLDAINTWSSAFIAYALTDLLLSVTSFVREIGGDPVAVLDELGRPDALATSALNLDQVADLTRRAVERAINFRDRQTSVHHNLIAKARAFIEQNYADPDLSLRSVAAAVLLSPSYLSLIFAREVQETFIEYLTRIRVVKARELLRTTALPSSEIAYRVGYNNPRYFYAVFRKEVGVSPNEFRHPHSVAYPLAGKG